METPGVPAQRPSPPLDQNTMALSEYELRQAIIAEDRNYLRGAGDVDMRKMAADFPEDRFRRYINLCRALRFKTRPDSSVHRKNSAAQS